MRNPDQAEVKTKRPSGLTNLPNDSWGCHTGGKYFVQRSNGGPHAIVLEHPDAIKTYLVRWNGVKIDLTELAKLRWIKNEGINEICVRLKKSRSFIVDRIRTIKNGDLSSLDLSDSELELIQKRIKVEGPAKRRSQTRCRNMIQTQIF